MGRWRKLMDDMSLWTKIIGWTQMGACLVILNVLNRTVQRLKAAKHDDALWHGKTLNYKGKQSVIVFSTIDIIRTALTAFFAIVLLVGAYKENVNHLVVWIEFMFVLNGFYVISTIVEGIELEMLDMISISQCTAVVLLHLLAISVVFRYKEKLQRDRKIKSTYSVD